MKYCEEYAALLDLFVDGELPAEEMKRVGDHLAQCPGCRAYVDDALAIRAAFPDVEDTAVPEGFAQGVMERVRESAAGERETAARKRRSLRRWMGTAALAACCALVILLRTGPAGGGSVPAGGAAINENSVTASVAEDAEMGMRMVPEAPAPAPAEAPAEARGAEPYCEDQAPLAAAAATEAALYKAGEDAALDLTEEEAGDLLDGFSPVWEDAVERRYELNKEEYRTLLEALGRLEEVPEAAEGPFLVVVTGPEE